MYIQLTIQARDMATPSKASETNARVTVRVYRNLNSPKFDQDRYLPNYIDRDVGTGHVVHNVIARDSDVRDPYNQVRYSIIGDSKARTYFEINEETGTVTVARDLNEDDSEEYLVSDVT